MRKTKEKDPSPKADLRKIRKQVKLDIQVPATESELLGLGKMAAKLSFEQTKLEEEKKAEAQAAKEQIDSCKIQLKSAMEQISTGKLRVLAAECTEEWDTEENQFRLWWGDRLVHQREMSKEEKRMYTDTIFNAARVAREDPIEKDFDDNIEAEDIEPLMLEDMNAKTKRDFLV